MRSLSINIYFISAICCLACNNINKPKAFKKAWPPAFRFYYRTEGGNDSVYTYTDYLVLENYVNNTYRLNDLADVARSYLDTAKGNLPIKGVVFVGEAPKTQLPPGMYKTYSDHVEYQIVTIAFEMHSGQKNKTRPPKKQIGVIITWKKGEPIFYFSPSVDSLVNANPLLDNEN